MPRVLGTGHFVYLCFASCGFKNECECGYLTCLLPSRGFLLGGEPKKNPMMLK